MAVMEASSSSSSNKCHSDTAVLLHCRTTSSAGSPPGNRRLCALGRMTPSGTRLAGSRLGSSRGSRRQLCAISRMSSSAARLAGSGRPRAGPGRGCLWRLRLLLLRLQHAGASAPPAGHLRVRPSCCAACLAAVHTSQCKQACTAPHRGVRCMATRLCLQGVLQPCLGTKGPLCLPCEPGDWPVLTMPFTQDCSHSCSVRTCCAK